mgnify:CR=1 FL=1
MGVMEVSLPFILGLAMFLTVVVLVFGFISFGVNGDFYSKHSNNLMRARVILQGLALALLAAILWLAAF